jgi:DNA-binding GntR family transcriptional regulator
MNEIKAASQETVSVLEAGDSERAFGPSTGAPPSGRAQQIHDGIVAAILEHRLHPGTKLGEDEIGAIYGVSRTIVRAALQSLSHEGTVVIEKNRGAFVASPSLAEAVEVFEARKLIEPSIARRAAERSTGEGIRTLNQHLQRERAALARGDEPTAIRLSGEFHLEIARMADHKTFEGFLRELVARSSLILLLYRRQKAQVCGTDHHIDLSNAIASGDGKLASSLMMEHLDDIESGLDLVEETGAVPPLASILRGG